MGIRKNKVVSSAPLRRSNVPLGWLGATLLLSLAAPASLRAVLPPPGKLEKLPTEAGLVVSVQPDKGYIDDAFAISRDGGVLFYVYTDGGNWATLRAVGMTPRVMPPTPAPPPPAVAPEPKKTPGKAPVGKGVAPPAAPPALSTDPPPAPVLSYQVASGKQEDVLTGLPLSIVRMMLLPDDRVLFVLRDQDLGNTLQGAVYSLKTKSKIALAGPGTIDGFLGPATDFSYVQGATGPEVVMINRPADTLRGEHRLHLWNANTLQLAASKTYTVSEADGKVPTDRGTGVLLYTLDTYRTLVVKHGGLFDKKKDMRQPDFLGFVDALTGRLRKTESIANPVGVLEWAKRREGHPEPQFVAIDPLTHQAELVQQTEQAIEGSFFERRVQLALPRAGKMYESTTLHVQPLRRSLLALSLTVDPVNDEALSRKTTDPDILDLCVLDPTATQPTVRKVLSLPGHKRPSAWVLSESGRFVILRKHKNFPRGGTQLDVYDVDLAPSSP